MGVVDIPGFGKINLFSVHIYNPSEEGVAAQIDNLLAFVNQMDGQNPAAAAIVAGDMNFSVTDFPAAYQRFMDNAFMDSYAAAQGFVDPKDCCSPAKLDGCTFGVPGNPLGSSDSPSRIDFIFVRGDKIRVKQSKVVFNGVNEDFVSDHSAVLTEISKKAMVPLELLLGD